MSLLSVLTTRFLTFTLIFLKMIDATFNFRLDTLLHEIEMHEHRDELIDLLREQVEDDRTNR